MRSFYLEASTETQAGQELRDWPIQFFLANYAAAAKVGDPDYSVVLNANPGTYPYKVRHCVLFTLWLQAESEDRACTTDAYSGRVQASRGMALKSLSSTQAG